MHHVSPTQIRNETDSTARLYGADPEESIVAVEQCSENTVYIYRRDLKGTIQRREEPLVPWLLADRADPWRALPGRPRVRELNGDHAYRFLVEFSTWRSFLDAVRAGRDASEKFFRFRSPVEQYLVRSGKTLFKGMVFADLLRLQLDIETLGLDSSLPDNKIISIAMRTSAGQERVFAFEGDEGALIASASAWLVEQDPDVIEGHNLFNFDLPYLNERASQLGRKLHLGRDGSALWIGDGEQRFKAGARTLPYRPAHVSGRHIIDTYQQIQRYDVAGRLSSYGLKPVVNTLFPNRERVTIQAATVRAEWESGEHEKLAAYNLDDVRDVDVLSRLTLPTEFYQCQILPRSLQSTATGGPGEKINDLMVRTYVHAGHSLPRARSPRSYPGGHTELVAVGAFSPVVKCDVESLYPSIMLSQQIKAESDVLNASLPMLADLTERRLDAKQRSRAADGGEREQWDGLQSSFKVLINSFYGYLGYGRGLYNDFDAAERVTLDGQALIRSVVRELDRRGAQPIEVDTDGVYFVPPQTVASLTAEETFIEEIGRVLPDGIRLAHDGRFSAMLSLKLKTYALLEHDGSVILKGSSLRSRRMERCLREFLRDTAVSFMTKRQATARAAYFSLAERILKKELEVDDISQWTMINPDTIGKQPRLSRLTRRTGALQSSGERLEIYEREDGELALASEYHADLNSAVLLRKLRDTAERFESLFADRAEFEAFFPTISARTDLELAKSKVPAHQLGLFG